MLYKGVEVRDTLMKIKAGVIELSKWICNSEKKMYQKMPKKWSNIFMYLPVCILLIV